MMVLLVYPALWLIPGPDHGHQEAVGNPMGPKVTGPGPMGCVPKIRAEVGRMHWNAMDE